MKPRPWSSRLLQALILLAVASGTGHAQGSLESELIRPPLLVTCDQFRSSLQLTGPAGMHLSEHFSNCPPEKQDAIRQYPVQGVERRLSQILQDMRSRPGSTGRFNSHEIEASHRQFVNNLREASRKTYGALANQYANKITEPVFEGSPPAEAHERIFLFIRRMAIFRASPVVVDRMHAWGFKDVEAIDAAAVKRLDARVFSCLDFASMASNWTMDEAVILEPLFEDCYSNPSRVLMLEGAKIDALVATINNPLRRTAFKDDLRNRALRDGGGASFGRLVSANAAYLQRLAAEERAKRAEEAKQKAQEQRARELQLADERRRDEDARRKAEEERQRVWWESLSENERQAILRERHEQNCAQLNNVYGMVAAGGDPMRMAAVMNMLVNAGCRR